MHLSHQHHAPCSLVACAVLAAIAMTIAVVTLIDASQPCSAPTLPDDLDAVVQVMRGDSRGIHLQGVYGLLDPVDQYNNDVGGMAHTLRLPARTADDGQNDRWLRVSLSPSPYDTKLFLYRRSRKTGDPGWASNELLESSDSGGGVVEQQIFYAFEATKDVAAPGEDLEFVLIIGYNLGWKNIQLGCPSVILELAIQTRDGNMYRFDGECADHPGEDWKRAPQIPQDRIDPSNHSDGRFYYKFASATSYANVGHTQEHHRNNKHKHSRMHVLASYKVEVPHLPDRHQKWKFRAAVHSNFVDGGDIGLMMLDGNFSQDAWAQTPRSCDEGSYNCFYSHRALKNTAVLQEQLVAGNMGQSGFYMLFLVLRRRESTLKEAACFPYELTVDLFPLPSEDTFINCEADPLIASLNSPGMYNNNTGILRYQSPVLLNLTMRRQLATLVTTKPKSIFRAWASSHSTVDVDLTFREKTLPPSRKGQSPRTLAYSMASYTPDGIVAELYEGVVYELEVTFATLHKRDTGVDDLDFQQLCDFFELQVHVFPVDEELNKQEREHDSNSNPLNGNEIAGALAKWFKETAPTPDGDGTENTNSNNNNKLFEYGKVSYSTYDHYYRIDTSKPIKQEIIAQFQLVLPRASLVSMTVSADAYSGTPVIEMTVAGGDAADVLYARHRGVGSYLYGQFDRGVYNVTLLTPYVQHEWSETEGNWDTKVPDIPPFIPYDFHLAVGPTEVCVSALPLPNKLEPTSETSHHHLGDVFRLAAGASGHDISVKVDKDSVLHFLADGASVPLDVSLRVKATNVVVVSAQKLQTTHMQHGQVYELFAGIRAGEEYILRIEAEAVHIETDPVSDERLADAEAESATCVTFEMELSVAPLPPTVEELPADSPLRQCDEAAGTEDFDVLPLPAAAVVTDVWKPNAAKGDYVAKFELVQSAHIRMIMSYDFMEDAPQLKLCPCTDVEAMWCKSQCVTSNVFFNGLEVPTTTLLPGKYAIVVGGWSGSFGSELSGEKAPQVIGACHRFHLKLVVAPFDEKPAPALCHVRMQHLPRSLNTVGSLSPHYGDQLHFLQELKLNSATQSDSSLFELTRMSIARVQVSKNDFSVGIDIKKGWPKAGAGGATRHLETVSYSWNGYGMYVLLPPGKYTLVADYNFEFRDGESMQQGGCVSVPVEIAILPVGDMARTVQSGDALQCPTSLPPFPSVLVSRAEDMRYRSPEIEASHPGAAASSASPWGYGFDHEIPFTVGDETGAFVKVDVMFSFEAGGLSMELFGGELQANGDYAPNRTFPVTRLMNRMSTDVYLQRGIYTLRIYDPVPRTRYAHALEQSSDSVAGCTRYSMRITTTDRGSSPTPSPVPERPHLECNGRYDFLPERLTVTRDDSPPSPPGTGGSAAGESPAAPGAGGPINEWGQQIRRQAPGQWSIVQGSRFQIPFEHAVEKTKALGNVVQSYKIVEIVINFDVAPGQYIRAWFRSKSNGRPSMRVVDPNGGADVKEVLLAQGKYFGMNTLSVSYYPGTSIPSSQLQLILKFVYNALPEYGVDYNDCVGLYRESSYELTFARFPQSHISDMVTCPSGAGAASNLPPTQISAAGSIHSTYYITGDDIAKFVKAQYGIISGSSASTSSWDFLLLPTFRHTIHVDIKHKGMYLMVFVDYNVLVSEMRATLVFRVNQSAVSFSDGEPTGAVDEQFDAQVFLHAARLQAGEYDIIIEQANAQRNLAADMAMYCIPFAAQILLGGGTGTGGGDSNGNNNNNGARVIAVDAPMPHSNIDVSDGLKLRVQLSEDADVLSLSGAKRLQVAALQDSFGGAPIAPYSVYFSTTQELVVIFKSMNWNYDYKLVLRPELIKTKSGDYTFAPIPSSSSAPSDGSAADLSPSFRTATCGCNAWDQCADGGACPCTEPSGITCSKCSEFAFLSAAVHTLGNAQDPAKVQMRICELHKGGWMPTTEAPDTGPTGDHNKHPHGNHSHPPGSIWVGPPLRFLRRFLAFSAVGAIFVYVAVSLWNYRKEIQQHAHNPFRVLSGEDDDEAAAADGTGIDLEETNVVHAGAGQ